MICLDTYLKETDSQVHILLVASENKTLKQWYVHSDVKNIVPVKNLTVFDTFWTRSCGSPRIAIANEAKKIQILNDDNLLTETGEISSQVHVICFMPHGDKIVYGLRNGDVNEFDLKTRKTECVFSLEAAVVFLECFEFGNSNVIVAGSDNSHPVIFANARLVSFQAKAKFSPIVKCFSLDDLKVLFTVSRNRAISVWSFEGEHLCNLIDSKPYYSVLSCELSSDRSLLACCTSNGFEVYRLRKKSDFVELELQENEQLQGKLTCCSFSHDGTFLAVGRDDGVVEVS